MRLSSGALSSSWLRRVNRRPSGRSFGSKPGTETIAFTAPVDGSSATTAPLRPFSPLMRGPLRARVERRLDVVALALGPGELVDERAQLAVEARQLVVVGALEAGAAEARERVADRVGEEPAGGYVRLNVSSGLRTERASTVPSAARIRPRRILRSASSVRWFFELARSSSAPKHRPARGEHDEHAEEQREHDEQAGDGRVHRPYSRRARSETSSSSASSTKLARIDEPP